MKDRVYSHIHSIERSINILEQMNPYKQWLGEKAYDLIQPGGKLEEFADILYATVPDSLKRHAKKIERELDKWRSYHRLFTLEAVLKDGYEGYQKKYDKYKPWGNYGQQQTHRR